MPLFIALAVVVLLAALGGLFFVAAWSIRRDINDRFERIRVRLEKDAAAIFKDLLNE